MAGKNENKAVWVVILFIRMLFGYQPKPGDERLYARQLQSSKEVQALLDAAAALRLALRPFLVGLANNQVAIADGDLPYKLFISSKRTSKRISAQERADILLVPDRYPLVIDVPEGEIWLYGKKVRFGNKKLSPYQFAFVSSIAERHERAHIEHVIESMEEKLRLENYEVSNHGIVMMKSVCQRKIATFGDFHISCNEGMLELVTPDEWILIDRLV